MRRWPFRRTPERPPSPLRSRFPAELLHRAKRKTAFRLSFFYLIQELVLALDNNTGTDGTAAFTDSEAEALLDRDGGDQLNVHVDVIAGHAHLGALGQSDDAGDVGGTEVELRTIVVEERGVTAALVLVQDVDLTNELGEGVNGTGLGQDLAALDLVLGNATEQGTDVIPSLA